MAPFVRSAAGGAAGALASFVTTAPGSAGPVASFVAVRASGSALGPSASGPGRPSVGRGAGADDPIPAEADAWEAAGPVASFVAVRAARSATGSTATGSEPGRGRSSGATTSQGPDAGPSSDSR